MTVTENKTNTIIEFKNSTLPKKNNPKCIQNLEFQNKINDILKLQRDQVPTSESLKQKPIKILATSIGGILFGYFLEVSGLSTGLHEVVGHGALGLHLTHDYSKGKEPSYQVDGWDNFKAIGTSNSPKDFFENIGKWLTGYDRNGDGAAGFATHGIGTPNALGQYMGNDGLQAWISLTGSLPGLILNSLTVAGGMKLRKKHSGFGSFLIACGLTQHLSSCLYPWTAVAASDHAFEHASRFGTGHDFINFSAKISNITGIAPRTIAITTASIWTLFVPAIALGIFLHEKSNEADIVPDHIAAQNWLSKAQNNENVAKTLSKLYESYPRKKKLESMWAHLLTKKPSSLEELYPLELRRFALYLIKKLPSKILKNEKEEILTQYKKQAKPKMVERVLHRFSIAGTITSIATKILQILAQTLVPALTVVAKILTFTSPLFVGVSVISSCYETYKDLKSPIKHIPKTAKVLSVAKLIISIATAIGIVTTLFLPGLNVILITTIAISTLTNLALSLAKKRVIKNRFVLLQSTQPSHWNFMYDVLKINHLDKKRTKKSTKNRIQKSLNLWIKRQKESKKKGLLSKTQINKLQHLKVV